MVGPLVCRAAKHRGLPESAQSFIRGVGTPHRQSAAPTKRRAYFLFISGSVRAAKRRTWFAAHRADKNAGRGFFRPGFYATKRPAVQRGFYKFMDVPDTAYRCNRF